MNKNKDLRIKENFMKWNKNLPKTCIKNLIISTAK